jgi:hypothetical protein
VAPPTIVPPASPDVAATWTLVARGDATKSEQFSSVVAVADGFVVTGSLGPSGDRATALHSDDGSSWTRESIPARPGMDPAGLIAWGDRVIAVGGGETGQCAHPLANDTWVRAADATWTEAPFDPVFCAGGGALPTIFRGRPWLVGDGSGDVPILMESTDGLTWADHHDRVGEVFLGTPVVDAAGMSILGRGFDGTSIVLRSADGVRWTRTPLRTAAGDPADVIAAVTVDDHIVVLATVGARIVRLVPDGDRWAATDVIGLPREDFASITAVGSLVVAIGSHDDGTRDVWVSADGVSWRQVAIPVEAGAGSTLLGAAIHDASAVFVGQIEAPGGAVAVGAIWAAPASIFAP